MPLCNVFEFERVGTGLPSPVTQLGQPSLRSGPPSPSPSPGPSGLNNELTAHLNNNSYTNQDEDGDVESAYAQTPDPNPDSAATSRAPSRGPSGNLQPNSTRSQSPSTSASPFPQPFAFGKTQLLPGKRIVLPTLPALQAPVAMYQSLGDDDDLDDRTKAVKRKGKTKQKQADNLDDHEEVDDRLYCICQSRYDANVDVGSTPPFKAYSPLT